MISIKGEQRMNLIKKIALVMAAASSLSLAALADGGAKFVGNITVNYAVRDDFGTYWNQITAENECKWESIDKGNGKYDFSGCDRAYNWAKNHNGKFKFHALIWGSQFPSRLCKDNNPNISAEETRQVIDAWFEAVHNHYPDLEMIDVVNEATWTGSNYHSGYDKANSNTDGCQSGSKIIEALGGDVVNGQHTYTFVTTAFKKARALWPDAILIYNDYNTIRWDTEAAIDLVKKIIAAGAPVDAYGQQAHDLDDLDGQTMAQTLTHIHDEVGIPLFITEYDLDNSNDQAQANRLAEQFPFMWETPWIAGITFWGYINGTTWRGNTGLLDANGNERESMKWLKKYLKDNLDKGQNDGFTPIEPEPQKPFKGTAFDLTSKIEAEDFDIPGKGTGNNSYSVSGNCDDTWNTTYRKGTSVKIGEKNGGLVIGCNATGNWYQYSIKVPATGNYRINAAVAADGEGSLVFKVGDTPISDTLKLESDSWTKFIEVPVSAYLTQGEQILTLEITKGYIDVDYFEFQKAACVQGSSENCYVPPSSSSSDNPMGLTSSNSNGGNDITKPHSELIGDLNYGLRLQYFTVFDVRGVIVGHASGYTIDEAIHSITLRPGLYIIQSKYETKKFVK